jgi:hypothetical protein
MGKRAAPENRPQSYVFIVTYGRSGSTLLQNMLNAIPGYQIRGENNNALLPLAQSWKTVRESEQMRALHCSQIETDPSHPWYGAEKVNPFAYGQALANTFSRTVLRPDPGIRVSGFKEIRYHVHPGAFRTYMDFIMTCFRKPRLIFNTRDHDSVARSGWWAEQESERVRRVLSDTEAMFAACRETYPHRSLAMHYDDYTGNPEAFRALFDFLGEPYDREMVERVLGTRLGHLKRTPEDTPATGSE